MKKLAAILFITIIAACFYIPVSAAPGDIIYMEDFENVKSIDELGYKISEELKPNTALYSIENGALLCTNLDSAIGGESGDSYLYILDDSTMDKYVNGDYTIQYDLKYVEAEEVDRYITLVYNYNGKDTYNSAHIRWCGRGNSEARVDGTFYSYEDAADIGKLALRNTQPGASILYSVFGIEYDGTAESLTNNANFKDKNMTVRIECSKTNGPNIYINDVLVSECVDTTHWGESTASALALKISKKIKGYVDNIIVYEGIGVEPNFPIEEIIVDEVEAAPVEVAQAPVTKAAQTFDVMFIAMAAAAISAGTFIVSKKRR